MDRMIMQESKIKTTIYPSVSIIKKGLMGAPFQTNLIYLQNQLFNYHHFLNQRLATVGNKANKIVTSTVV